MLRRIMQIIFFVGKTIDRKIESKVLRANPHLLQWNFILLAPVVSNLFSGKMRLAGIFQVIYLMLLNMVGGSKLSGKLRIPLNTGKVKLHCCILKTTFTQQPIFFCYPSMHILASKAGLEAAFGAKNAHDLRLSRNDV